LSTNTNSGKKHTILVVDDHPIIREGISKIINQQPDLEVIGEAVSGIDAMQFLKKTVPDMAIIDISLKDSSGIDLIKEIKLKIGLLPILVLSMHPETLYAERVLRVGARGYIMKHEPSEKIIYAIRRILQGKIYLSPEISEKILDGLAGTKQDDSVFSVNSFSDRELEVFQLIGQGFKPHQIAERLFLSVKTIETYTSRLKKKLNVETASELRILAINWQQKEDII
jgi:DNA-binding NarL/FixJ family response regulator